MKVMNTDRLWEKGLARTRGGVLGKIAGLFAGRKRISDDMLDELERILIESDIGVKTTLDIIEQIRQRMRQGRKFTEEGVREILKETLIERVRSEWEQLNSTHRPYVVLIVGVNGTGKTTTIGKLAYMYKKRDKKVLLACADTFRAASAEQLEEWSRRAGADLIRQSAGADPASVAFDALEAAIARRVDILIIDTAGRLHTKVNLMEELGKIFRVLRKKSDTAPHEVLLVIDATTGQNGLNQARLFAETVDVSGIVLTKLDGTARGGIVVSIYQELGIPVKWVGLGEGLEDIVPFDAEAFVEGMLG